jgi:uncharacterized phage-like protein YoqJ
MIVSLTGHRPHKLGGYDPRAPRRIAIRRQLAQWCQEHQPSRIITGMALGFDQDGAVVAYNLGIPYTAALPCWHQNARWNAESTRQWQWLLDHADEIIVVTQAPYSPPVMQARNVWMVDHSDLVYACWDGSPGGTANCVTYARSIGRELVIVPPPRT